jgi:hypothetical protein
LGGGLERALIGVHAATPMTERTYDQMASAKPQSVLEKAQSNAPREGLVQDVARGLPAGLPVDAAAVLAAAPELIWSESREELFDLAVGGAGENRFSVEYPLPGGGVVGEATVVRCRNGVAINYDEPYMRRRDPHCMLIADERPTDKARFESRFTQPFVELRREILQWLAAQPLVALPFRAGDAVHGYDALVICPSNAAFFAAGLADLQGLLPGVRQDPSFRPRAIIYVAPPFRHTHCQGKQVVIHNRTSDLHEIFSLNLYPGPSAKKGVYGVLLTIGEGEGWITAHGATVQVVTPYENTLTIMHEGASGGGKSEMLEYPHRDADGRLCLGENLQTGERLHLPLEQGCTLRPVTDDMALCHPELQNDSGRLVVTDAENGWFVRVDHISRYGTDPVLERLCIHPPKPLIFLNVDAVAGSTALLWEHIADAKDTPCPNPRVIMPRRIVSGIVNSPVEVHVRSFGVRTPPCSADRPSYGIIGFLHLLPPALAWLWRLVSPRGHANPSITDQKSLSSEGVGSYWPFATGRRVDQANLLLEQIVRTPGTRYTMSPNQHVGAWRVGFMPQWIAREYMARRGPAGLSSCDHSPARCPLLGYALDTMTVEGTTIPRYLLHVERQFEVGEEAYDAGARILHDFFLRELKHYDGEKDLSQLGRRIIACCVDGGSVGDYEKLLA